MPVELSVRRETWPIRGTFRISRGSKQEAVVVVVEARDRDVMGRGEAVPYPRYGESAEQVVQMIERLDPAVLSRRLLPTALPAGAARCAVDCALWELDAKRAGTTVWELAGVAAPIPVRTTHTLSIDSPEAMGDAARRLGATHLKLKLGGDGRDLARVEAVRRAAPDAVIVADPNESWTVEALVAKAPRLVELGVSIVEQPISAVADEALLGLDLPGLIVCADEAVHTSADLEARAGRYGAINVKLGKAGGLTEALALTRAAKARSLRVMVGCMVCTSLAIAPAFVLSTEADEFDLDGPLLLSQDRSGGVTEREGLLHPPILWGR